MRTARLLAVALLAAFAALPAAAQAILFLEPEHLSTADILGREVDTADGGHLGPIRDLLIDLRTRRVEYLAFERGAYPVSALRAGEGLRLLLEARNGASAGASAPPGLVRLSELVGRKLGDGAGGLVGRIRDVTVNAVDGTVEFCVVEAAKDGTLVRVPLPPALERLLN